MPNLREMIQSITARTRVRRARLPWRDLEAGAARQGCSPADIFFDWAGQPIVDSDVQFDQDGPVSRASSDPARRAAT
jgi:hypothetical protein